MEEMYAVFGILALVVIGAGAMVAQTVISGDVVLMGYSGSKLYGPALKNAYKTPQAFGHHYANQVSLQAYQDYLSSNRKTLVCGFTSGDGANPCWYDPNKGSWCCTKYVVSAPTG